VEWFRSPAAFTSARPTVFRPRRSNTRASAAADACDVFRPEPLHHFLHLVGPVIVAVLQLVAQLPEVHISRMGATGMRRERRSRREVSDCFGSQNELITRYGCRHEDARTIKASIILHLHDKEKLKQKRL
jgi:hypothetical protein